MAPPPDASIAGISCLLETIAAVDREAAAAARDQAPG